MNPGFWWGVVVGATIASALTVFAMSLLFAWTNRLDEEHRRTMRAMKEGYG